MRKRGTVIIDPPWPYQGISSDRRLLGYSAKEYKPMTIAALAKLPIAKLADYVFLWTTPAFLEQAFKLVRTWGLVPVTTIYWVKATITEERGLISKEPIITADYGVGYWFRGVVEPIIVAKRPRMDSIRSQYIGLLSPNIGHSRKPKSLHEIIEKHYPKPRIELFAREQRVGWTCLGDELQDKSIEKSIQDFLWRSRPRS